MPASFLKRYRFEDFVAELDAFMKANLGGYIAQMNLDKTDMILATPVAASYFFQSMTETEAPYDPFVFYGEIGTDTANQGPDEINRFTIQVAIIMANTNELQGVMGKRLLRYRDCLKALFNQGWNGVNKRVKLEVTGISPFPFTTINSDTATHMGIGVTIQMEIA
jgi:hypothetical protein